MKYVGWFCLGVAALFAIGVGFTCARVALAPVGYANRVLDVAGQQFDPAMLLKRYEWFKDAAAALDQKQASVKVYNQRLKSQAEAYVEVARKDWPRDEREQRSIWQSEVAGIKASYNELAAEYNAQMAKFNWRFTNRGMLPQGATEPLPREFKPYVEE